MARRNAREIERKNRPQEKTSPSSPCGLSHETAPVFHGSFQTEALPNALLRIIFCYARRAIRCRSYAAFRSSKTDFPKLWSVRWQFNLLCPMFRF
jgi:hypothetical protein